MTETITDITILGGGPTGLFAAFYCGLRNASCKIIDSLPMLGGRLSAIYPEKYIYDVAGFPKITAQGLVDQLVEQIKPYGVDICLEECVQGIHFDKDQNLWLVHTQRAVHKTRALIIAAGVGQYTPKRHDAPSASKYEGKGLSYTVLNKNFVKDKDVLVAGGGDSALDWTHEFLSLARSVTLVHRSAQFRAHENSVEKLKGKKNLNIILNTEIVEFKGSDNLESVILRNVDTGEVNPLNVDEAVIMFGYNSSLGHIREWGLELTGQGIAVDQKMRTNLPGVFAAGDVARHEAKLDLIVSGFSEAAIAVAFAKNYLTPKEKPQPLHSTTIMELKEKKLKKAQVTV